MESCPYCGAVELTSDPEPAGIAPDSLIPFRIISEQALDALAGWLKLKRFVPCALKRLIRSGKITGLFVPQWLYEDDVSSEYHGKSGRYYQLDIPVKVTDADGKERTEKHRERRIRWEKVTGTICQAFDDVMLSGSEHLPMEQLRDNLQVRLDHLVRYSPEYIAGYVCEKPTVDVQEGWKTAQNQVDRRVAELAQREIKTYSDEASVSSVESRHENVRYKLIYLPLYMLLFHYRKKTYRILTNGENGKVSGEVPKSPFIITALILILLALLGGLFLLFWLTGGSEYLFKQY